MEKFLREMVQVVFKTLFVSVVILWIFAMGALAIKILKWALE